MAKDEVYGRIFGADSAPRLKVTWSTSILECASNFRLILS
jgi:hypothetical protein